MNIVLFGDYPALQEQRASKLLGLNHNVFALFDSASASEIKEAFADAEVIVSNSYDASLPPAPKCRLLQSPSAGIEKIDLAAVPQQAMVATASGHEVPMAEYVCCGLLEDAVGLSAMPKEFKNGHWSQKEWIKGPRHHEVHGKVLGLLGYGGVGRHVAARATAFGMKVHALSRWSQGLPDLSSEPIDAAFSARDWRKFLADLDYLVVTIPLSDATQSMIDAAWFDASPQHLMLVNVARGGVIEEQALFSALKDRKIRKALIDVWYRYPATEDEYVIPSRFPFHELDNVIMTPHTSGRTDQTFERRWQGICENVKRLSRGEAPVGQVIRRQVPS